MLDNAVVITGLVSVLTLALSRCRCIVRSTPEGHTQWELAFADAELFHRRPLDPPEHPQPRLNATSVYVYVQKHKSNDHQLLAVLLILQT